MIFQYPKYFPCKYHDARSRPSDTSAVVLSDDIQRLAVGDCVSSMLNIAPLSSDIVRKLALCQEGIKHWEVVKCKGFETLTAVLE